MNKTPLRILCFSIIFSLLFSAGALTQTRKSNLRGTKKSKDTTETSPGRNTIIEDKSALPDSALTSGQPGVIDSTFNIAEKDTIPPNLPLYRHGSATLIPKENFMEIGKDDMLFITYTSFSEIIYSEAPCYPLSLGAFGHYNHFSIFGSGPRDVSFAFNGRPVNDPEYGSLNPTQIPTEFLEKAEIMVGSDAAVLGGSPGAFINIQEIRYDTKLPYTRIWFGQDEYDFLSADGIFSQNFIKNWNFTLGFRHASTPNKYSNSDYENWNIRGILRWNPGDLTSISLTESFTNHGLDLFGGIDAESTADADLDGEPDICDRLEAYSVFGDFNERVFRHDLNLSFSTYLAADSASAFHSTAFVSYAEWNRNRGEDLFLDESDSAGLYSWTDRQFGISGKYEQDIVDLFLLRAGGDVLFMNTAKTPYWNDWDGLNLTAFGHLEMKLPGKLLFSGGIRFGTQYEKIVKNIGSRLRWQKSDKFSLFGDLSFSERASSPSESIGLSSEKHITALAGGKIGDDSSFVTFNLFGRRIESPILNVAILNDNGNIIDAYSYNAKNRDIYGGTIEFGTQIFDNFIILNLYDDGRLMLGGKGIFQISLTDGSADERFPAAYGKVRIYYQAFAGRSMMNLGVEAGFITSKKGEYFLPQTRSYIPYAESNGFSFTGLDAFAELKLGVAYLRLKFHNLLSQCYYYVPVYPQYGMGFRMTFSWPFMD